MSAAVSSADFMDRFAPPNTLADALFARGSRRCSAVTEAMLVVAASLLVAFSAQVSINLPFTPVPISGQTFAVLLVGMLLGSRRGAIVLGFYLWEGAIGLPFFHAGTGGIAVLLGPTAGYLWSFPIAAALVGFLSERGWDRRPLGAALTMALGSVVILGCGVLYLANFVGGIHAAFLAGAVPFLPGEVVKVVLATALLPGGWALVRGVKGR